MASSVPPAPPGAPPVVDPDILHGWKEIAAFAGKSVRTVQRWERDAGFPVRRLGPDREIVIALRSELSQWLRQADPDAPATTTAESAGRAEPFPPPALPTAGRPPAPADSASSAALWIARIAALAAIAGLVVWLSGAWPLTRQMGDPASWKVAGNTFSVFDAEGGLLWSYRSAHQLAEEHFEASRSWVLAKQLVRFVDLESDGTVETLLAEHRADQNESRLVVFEAGGRVRFTWVPDRVRFGDQTYQAPWVVLRLDVLWEPDGSATLWPVFAHRPYFPSVVAQLSPAGQLRGAYWSAGYVTSLQASTWGNRRVVLVGSVHNETTQAALAVLDHDPVSGSSPAVNPDYRCTSCGSDVPETFLVFPRGCLSGRKGEFPGVGTSWFDAAGNLTVEVRHAGYGASPASVLYTIDASLSSAQAEFVSGYAEQHQFLERAGTLDHPFGPDDIARALPVRKWNGSAFVPLDAGPVTRPR